MKMDQYLMPSLSTSREETDQVRFIVVREVVSGMTVPNDLTYAGHLELRRLRR